MSTAYYFRIDGVQGECRESDHKGWCTIEHFNFGVRQSVSFKAGQGGNFQAGEADFHPITVRMNVDKSYPKLAELCWKGAQPGVAEIHAARAGGDKLVFLKYKFTDVAISSVNLTGDAHGDDVAPSVEFTMVFKQIENEFCPTKLEGGGIEGSVVTGYNTATRLPV